VAHGEQSKNQAETCAESGRFSEIETTKLNASIRCFADATGKIVQAPETNNTNHLPALTLEETVKPEPITSSLDPASGSETQITDIFSKPRMETTADGTLIIRDKKSGISAEVDHHLGSDNSEVWESSDISYTDKTTGEVFSVPGSFRLEKTGLQDTTSFEYEELAMTTKIDHATGKLSMVVNDETKIELDREGNLAIDSPTHKIQLSADGNYRETDLVHSTSYNVDKHGIVTTIDGNGKSEHYRLNVCGTDGARLQNIEQDQKGGEIRARFSDGSTRKLLITGDNITSVHNRTKPDGTTTESYETLTMDNFAKGHLAGRISLATKFQIPILMNENMAHE
jgi:hypothetical protein